jgi:hypothetical protein
MVCEQMRFIMIYFLMFNEIFNAGILTLGGVDQSIHKKREKIQYAKLVPNTEYWSVQIASISLEPGKVDDFSKLNKGGVIFDSGSTDSVFPTAVKSLFTKVIYAFICIYAFFWKCNVIIVAQLSPGDPRVEKDGQRKSFRVQTRSIEYSSFR